MREIDLYFDRNKVVIPIDEWKSSGDNKMWQAPS